MLFRAKLANIALKMDEKGQLTKEIHIQLQFMGTLMINTGVDYFNNKATTVNASLSSVFTEMLKEHFTRQTSLEQIEDDGDLSFEGEITSYTIKPISIQANETARQNRLTIKVQVKFVNKFDKNHTQVVTFINSFIKKSSKVNLNAFLCINKLKIAFLLIYKSFDPV